jgi:hypothetical protein
VEVHSVKNRHLLHVIDHKNIDNACEMKIHSEEGAPLLVTATLDNRVYVHNILEGYLLRKLVGHTGMARYVNFVLRRSVLTQ